ncbi:MAG: hypothetical protein Q4C47_06760, partial [Planctomycetia bacterium]|nr:hypothetical protein [Planctomycetia bacterium]
MFRFRIRSFREGLSLTLTVGVGALILLGLSLRPSSVSGQGGPMDESPDVVADGASGGAAGGTRGAANAKNAGTKGTNTKSTKNTKTSSASKSGSGKSKSPASAKGAKQAGAATEPTAQTIQGEYREDPVREINVSEIRPLLGGGALDQATRSRLSDYYRRCAFPRWTKIDQLDRVAGWRDEFRSQLRQVRSGAKYDLLVSCALEFANRVTRSQSPGYHPVAVFNAILMVGDLNQAEEGASPRPHPEGLKFLGRIFMSDTSTDLMRIAAVTGLTRHATSGAGIEDANTRAVIQRKCLEIAATQVGSGRDAAGKNWLRLTSIRLLAAMKDGGRNAEIGIALAKVVEDADTPDEIRMEAVLAIGSLRYQPAQGVNGLDILRPLLNYYLESVSGGIQRTRTMDVSYASTIDAWRTPLGRGGGSAMLGGPSASMMSGGPSMSGGPGMGGYGMGGSAAAGSQAYGAEDRERAFQLRRTLLTVLAASRNGIAGPSTRDPTGPMALLSRSSEEKSFFDQLLKDIDEQAEKLNRSDETIREESEEKVREESKKNRRIMGAFDTLASELNEITNRVRGRIGTVASLADLLEGGGVEEVPPAEGMVRGADGQWYPEGTEFGPDGMPVVPEGEFPPPGPGQPGPGQPPPG